MRLLWILLAATVLFSCSKSKKKAPSVSYIVKGDPREFIRGADLSGSTNMSASEFRDVLDGMSYGGDTTFSNKMLKPEFMNYISPMSQTKDIDQSNSSDDTFYTYQINNDIFFKSDKTNYTIIFKARNGKIEVDRFELNDGRFVKVEHKYISVKKDKRVVTLLFYVDNFIHNDSRLGRGKALIMYTYIKPEKRRSFHTSKSEYRYLDPSDRSRKVRWNNPQELKFEICGETIHEYQAEIEESADAWNDAADGLISISTPSRRNSYPPFSDVNSACIYSVDSYITKGPNQVNAAFVLPSAYLSNPDIIDTDMFILKKELAKSYKNSPAAERHYIGTKVIKHEMGHMLGLDHKCVRGEDECIEHVHSIMSYEEEDTYISHYDREAIQELYSEFRVDNVLNQNQELGISYYYEFGNARTLPDHTDHNH